MKKQALEMIYSAAAAAAVVVAIGSLSVWVQQPWLFASLGPTVVIQITSPEKPIARPWNVAIGHLLALAVAMLAIYVTGAVHAASFSESQSLAFSRAGAAALAIALGTGFELLLGASHPPSASTALLVALGIVPPSWQTIETILVGILLVTALGEIARQITRSLVARHFSV
jgi:CBS-domain-containing membrane protein